MMVSVIIPNYNHAAYLNQRIESVLNQTHQNFELIILDDCSSDSSRDIIEQYRNHTHVSHIVYNDHNSGSTFRQWKKGLALAKGDWIWIAESDDFCESGFLDSLLKVTCESCLLRYCASAPVNSHGNPLPDMTYPVVNKSEYKAEDFLRNYFIENNVIINASSVLIEKNVLERSITSAVLNHRLFGDWLVWMNALLQTDISFLNKPKNYHRHHSGTVRNQLANNYNEVIFFRKEVERLLKESSLPERHLLISQNNQVYSNLLGSIGCTLIRQGDFFRSVPFILKATFNSGFDSSHLKDAAYWAFKAKQ